jgi:hypothetical protein
MPPLSYIITAIVLAALVAVSFPATLGFAIILWAWLFAAAACILTIVGGFRVVGGLHAPLRIGVALALPSCVWAADALHNLINFASTQETRIFQALIFAAILARAAAGFGALRLMEFMSTPHAAFRVGYGVLAVTALMVCVNWCAFAMGWTFTHNVFYGRSSQALGIAAMLIEYGAFIGATAMITIRRDVERWTGAVISLIIAYLFYQATLPYEVLVDDTLMFWTQPVVMLIGAAAVWRMGSVLRAQVRSQRGALS